MSKEKKSIAKKWWFWLILGIILIAIVSSNSNSNNQANETEKSTTDSSTSEKTTESTEATDKKERLTLDDGWELDKSNPYLTKVTGYVSNNSDKAISGYIQITFSALDAQGANVGDCLANANTVDANGKWKFEAMCTGSNDTIETVRFKELTGF